MSKLTFTGGSAFPRKTQTVVFEKGHEGCAQAIWDSFESGLSKREWFAGMALQGIIACLRDHTNCYDVDARVTKAFQYADAMLKAGQQERGGE